MYKSFFYYEHIKKIQLIFHSRITHNDNIYIILQLNIFKVAVTVTSNQIKYIYFVNKLMSYCYDDLLQFHLL